MQQNRIDSIVKVQRLAFRQHRVFSVVVYPIHYNQHIKLIHKIMEKQLHVRVSEVEMKALERYAKKIKRTKTDIIREFLWSLPV